MPAPYVEEFLYRGRCPDTEKGMEGAYQVVLAKFSTGIDGKPTQEKTAVMTPAQAASLGFTLPVILASINTAALAEATAAKAAKEAAEAALEAERAAHEETKAEVATLETRADVAEQAAEALQERLAAVTPEPTEEEKKPSNPALHWITRGLLGN